MRRWIALLLLATSAMVVALVLAIVRTHDDVPADLRTCIENSDGQYVLGPDVLGPLRADLANETGPRVVEDVEIGGNEARLYEGTGYRLLIMTGRGSEALDAEAPLRAYEDAASYSVVAIERDPVEGALAACAEVTG